MEKAEDFHVTELKLYQEKKMSVSVLFLLHLFHLPWNSQKRKNIRKFQSIKHPRMSMAGVG